jgi:hypothetical protein
MIRFCMVENPVVFDERPELAMGIHFAVPGARSRQARPQDTFIVFNGTIGVRVADLSEATEPLPMSVFAPNESDSAEEWEGGDRLKEKIIHQSVREGRWKVDLVDLHPSDDVELLIRVLDLPEWSRRRFIKRGEIHGSPPFRGRSRAGQVFVRFSRYILDRRITANGGLLPGTFATSKLDAQVVNTALTAVGHYALPSVAPPIYRFEIVPPPLTDLYYGTVSPAFGQSGGGTEIEFFRGVPDGAVSDPLMIPYL